MQTVTLIRPIIGVFLVVAIWVLFAHVAGGKGTFLPAPAEVFSRLGEILQSARFIDDLFSSVWRWLGGYILGCAVGIPVGLLLGTSQSLYSTLEFPLEFFRSLPVTAVFPLFLLVFGIGDGSKIAMVFTATVFVVILNSAYGVANSTQARVKMARVFGATQWQVFRYVVALEALPQVLVGMRTTLSLSLIVVIVSEMFIGTQFGLGQRVFESYQRNAIVDLYALLLVIGMLGYLSNRVFVSVERRYVDWAGQ